jgi:hypothetical protein
MYIVYMAHFQTQWKQVPSNEHVDDPGKLEPWVEQQAVEALRNKCRVYLYWPYWDTAQAPKIVTSLENIKHQLTERCLLKEPGFFEKAKSRLRHLGRPIEYRLERVDDARCVVFYAESTV